MITDSFNNDFDFLLERLKNKDSFVVTRFGDGEYKILRNEPITNCDGWTFDPAQHSISHEKLTESFQYDHKDYYIGIACPCCQGPELINWCKENSAPNLTWANIFVNANFPLFVEKMVPVLNSWEGRKILLANEGGLGKQLPLDVDKFVPCNGHAFLSPYVEKHIEEMSELAKEEDGQLFLLSAGPLANILACNLHQVNPNNTYLNIGSVLVPFTGGKFRGYLGKPPHMQKNCVW